MAISRRTVAISRRPVALAIGSLLLALVPPIAALTDQPFYVDLFRRMMIFAIAAVSLDLILGYRGMVSFGHAAYLGIGAYAVGIPAFYGIENGVFQFGLAIVASALVALVIGAISLRTSGVYFIMITLAFAQMLYYLGISLETYGGDNGMRLAARSRFGGDCFLPARRQSNDSRCDRSLYAGRPTRCRHDLGLDRWHVWRAAGDVVPGSWNSRAHH